MYQNASTLSELRWNWGRLADVLTQSRHVVAKDTSVVTGDQVNNVSMQTEVQSYCYIPLCLCHTYSWTQPSTGSAHTVWPRPLERFQRVIYGDLSCWAIAVGLLKFLRNPENVVWCRLLFLSLGANRRHSCFLWIYRSFQFKWYQILVFRLIFCRKIIYAYLG